MCAGPILASINGLPRMDLRETEPKVFNFGCAVHTTFEQPQSDRMGTFAWLNQFRRLRLRYDQKSRYAQGVSIARVRSDLLEVPTGLLPVIGAFQTDNPHMR